MTVDTKNMRNLDIPKNAQMFGVTYSGSVIPLRSDLSGQIMVDVQIGDIIAIISGSIYVYSGEIHLLSGSVTLGSGGQGIGNVGVNSGFLAVQSGLIGVTSGEVHITSGSVTLASGGEGIGNVGVNSGHISVQSGLVGVTSGRVDVLSGEIHILSGEVIAKISGEVLTTKPITDVLPLFSGYGTTFSMVYSGYGFTTNGKTTIGLYNYGGGSGTNYTIRGYIISGYFPISLTSGTLYSGNVSRHTLTDPYSYVDVGLVQYQSGYSSSVSVYVARR
jgi:hypothetical protein